MRNWTFAGYVGFGDRTDVDRILDDFPASAARKLLVGIHADHKAFFDGSTKKRSLQANAFICDTRTFNILDYRPKNKAKIAEELLNISASINAPRFDGFQLRCTWPSPLLIESFMRTAPMAIVLRIGQKAFEAAGNSAKRLALKARDYEGLATHILLDFCPIERFRADLVESCLGELRTKTSLGLAVGGIDLGSCGCSKELYAVARKFPGLSVEAEATPDIDPFPIKKVLRLLKKADGKRRS